MNSQDDAAVRMATTELVAVADVFRRISDSCWTKCVANMLDGDLTPGEASCIDRCVSKYQDVQAAVSTQLQSTINANSAANGFLPDTA